ncbi:MAG: Maf-like protein [Bacteroidales bacterium]
MKWLRNLDKYRIVLGSQSPRRQYLLAELGLDFEVMVPPNGEENFPDHLGKEDIPVFLARGKAGEIMPLAGDNALVITADTIVWCRNRVVNKPSGPEEAREMLRLLSGRKHEVHTGVCLVSGGKSREFHSRTDVWFTRLTGDEIEYYIEHCEPFDKAGAYGIQEWIGYIGIEKISGSYFNVMGLPVQQLYHELKKF